jgi:hypothetical protein
VAGLQFDLYAGAPAAYLDCGEDAPSENAKDHPVVGMVFGGPTRGQEILSYSSVFIVCPVYGKLEGKYHHKPKEWMVSVKVNILSTNMTHSEENGYLGHVQFEVDGHKKPYEMTLQSDRRLDKWNYALNFLNESGNEEEIEAVEKAIEEDDEFFDTLVEATLDKENVE